MVEPVAIAAAWRWIDDNARRLGAESVGLGAARGRIPLGLPRAASDVPATSCALEEGYAVSAEATVGAAPYNPLPFAIAEAGDGALPRGTVARVGAGRPLPAGANAVLPCDAVEPEGDGRVSVLAPVADGAGVAVAAGELRAGEPLWPAGRGRWPLRAAEIGLLAGAGSARIDVIRRPRTRILAAGAPDALEVLGPMLHALVERDGGAVIDVARLEPGRVRAADLAAGADVVLVAGGAERRAGAGVDAIVAGDGEMAVRGVAIEPGRESCLARAEDTLIALLPGLPAACFWSYELVAGRALRCRGGRDPGFPFASRRLRTTRKIASPLGLSEVVPVRLDPAAPGAVIPFPNGPSPRLRDAAAADGFLLVPAASEGFPAGSELPVWLFGPLAPGVGDHGVGDHG
jgi:molybdopterin molybdotransferase